MERRVAIVGAGISGLLACKYAASKGFSPVVFEADDQVGGLWNHTIESTRLQVSKPLFEFSDFPWPSSADTFPHNTQLLEYLQSYARNFRLMQYIKFNSKVVGIDYDEPVEDMQAWELWGGAGKAFGTRGSGISKLFTPNTTLFSRRDQSPANPAATILSSTPSCRATPSRD